MDLDTALRVVDLARDGGAMSAAVALLVEAAEAAMRAEVDRRAGVKGSRMPGRTVQRWGTTRGEICVGGVRAPVTRPRLRCLITKTELPLESYAQWAAGDLLAVAARRLTGRVSTRDYAATLDAVPDGARGASSSAVSRRVIDVTGAQLADLTGRALPSVPVLALEIDGVGVGGQIQLCALAVLADGRRMIAGRVDGPQETKRLTAALVRDLLARGLTLIGRVLVVIDGSRAIRTGVRSVLGRRAIVQRCRVHKIRNVCDLVPAAHRDGLRSRLLNGYAIADYAGALAALRAIAADIDPRWPAAAACLRRDLTDTLTITRLGLQATLGAALGSTNAIENAFSHLRRYVHRVRRWMSDTMRARWAASALLDAERRLTHSASGLGALAAILRGRRSAPAPVASSRVIVRVGDGSARPVIVRPATDALRGAASGSARPVTPRGRGSAPGSRPGVRPDRRVTLARLA